MAALGELRKKMRGVTSTQQITRAMKMVAGARFVGAIKSMYDARTYAQGVEQTLMDFLRVAHLSPQSSPLVSVGPDAPAGKVGVVVITGDKGLCGEFNNSVLKALHTFHTQHAGRVNVQIAVGRKAVRECRKNPAIPCREFENIFNALAYGHADRIGQHVIRYFLSQQLGALYVIYNNFVSKMKQETRVVRLLPVECQETGATQIKDLQYEPLGEDEVVFNLAPFFVKARIYAMLRESYAAELSARLRAMDNATRNAGTIIDTLKLEINKVRQSMITREIAEIIGTNEVLQ